MRRLALIAMCVSLVVPPTVVADELGGGDPTDRGGNTGRFWCPCRFFDSCVPFTADGSGARLEFRGQTWSTIAGPCLEEIPGSTCRRVSEGASQSFLDLNIDNVVVLERDTYLANFGTFPDYCGLLGTDSYFEFYSLDESDFVFRDLFDTAPHPGWDLSGGVMFDPDFSGPSDLNDPDVQRTGFHGGSGGSLVFGNPNEPPTLPDRVCGTPPAFLETVTTSINIGGLEPGKEYVLVYWWHSRQDFVCGDFGLLCTDDGGNPSGLCPPGDLWVTVFSNESPDCTNAAPSVAHVWPPNHRMVPITIEGVTDPDGGTPTITITGITQDEPIDARGSGRKAPDASGVGTSTAFVRAERSGRSGNGRVYEISFVATDVGGAECQGSVRVCVDKDGECVDDGQSYDSTGGALSVVGSTPSVQASRVSVNPNPFNPSTTLKFTVSKPEVISLTIYDVRGHRIKSLANGEHATGVYQVSWDGRNDADAEVASGVYMYRFVSRSSVEAGRLFLVR